MSEDEAEAERPAETDQVSESSASDEVTVGDDETAVDRAAESFVEIEAELRSLTGSDGGLVGLAVDAECVPASAVPDGYPVTITSEEALRLRVLPDDTRGSITDQDASISDEEASVYAEWPPADDGAISRLLALRGIDAGEFADLHGERIPVAIEDGFLVLRLPPGGRRGSPTGVYGVLLGLGANLGALALLALGAGSVVASLPVLLALVLLNVLVLPVGTYLDARHLLTTTDWDQGPLFWAALAMLPGVNVLSSLAYLYTRSGAEPV